MPDTSQAVKGRTETDCEMIEMPDTAKAPGQRDRRQAG